MSAAKRQHPAHPAPSSADEAREAARVLHETIKDARAILRELRAARDDCNELGRTAVRDMNTTVRALQKHMDEQTDVLRAAIGQASVDVQNSHAELLGFTTAEEVMDYIIRQVTRSVLPSLKEGFDARLPDLVRARVDEMVKNKPKRDLAKRVAVVNGAEVLRSLGVVETPEGAPRPTGAFRPNSIFGSVPGPR